ncbi:uncharacterized protein LOC133723187 [Rosa rugosa]|uniref:uncharacterized protein LOC133723187 n=1 Tax=Rosa rugosa TaxID=74645 RepID=UPI002B4115B6|nr:uncharacterized protein LOC133723187 [Rosa rugosa]
MQGTEELRVCDLIDSEAGEWNVWLLHELLMDSEVMHIVRIPLSLNGGDDRLIWHFDKKSQHNVKNGYHVARLTEQLGRRASTSESHVEGEFIFKKLWKINVPPKVKLQTWCLVKGILPTRVALAKRVQLSDVMCPFCSVAGEDGRYVFKECDVVNVLWRTGTLKLKPAEHSMQLVVEWICAMFRSLPGDSFNPVGMHDWVVNYLEDFKKHHVRSRNKERRPIAKWLFPPRGRLKVNVDGGFRVEHGCGGIGVVV